MIKFHNCLLMLLICTFAGQAAYAAPKPTMSPNAKNWTLNVTYEHPRQIAVKCPGDKNVKKYWYTILSITNKTGKDVPFYPQFDLMTDTFEVVPAGKKVQNFIFDEIKKTVKGKYPFLISMDEMPSKILQGEDNTVDLAIIWPEFDSKSKNVKFFFAGLSNETTALELLDKKDNEVKVYYLRKTLVLDYAFPGDSAINCRNGLKFLSQDWVMR